MVVFGALLAAGSAERFRAPKLLLPAGTGETVLSSALREMRDAVDGPVMVVAPRDPGMHQAALAPFLGERARLHVNQRSDEGLGTSVALAASVAQAQGAHALLLMPGDLPGVYRARLSAIVRRYLRERPWAVAAEHEGRLQTPALFDRRALPALSRLAGTRGAQVLLRAPQGRVLTEEMGPEELMDLDLWPAYSAIAHHLGWHRETPQDVLWQDDAAGRQGSLIWHFGEHTQGIFTPGAGRPIRAARKEGRLIVAGEGTASDALALVRCAALLALRRED